MLNKGLLIILCAMAGSASLDAQTIVVKKEKAPLRKEYGQGFEVVLTDATYTEVADALGKWVRNYGKTRSYDAAVVVEQPTLYEKAYAGRVFAQARQTADVVSAWIGLLPDEWSKKEIDDVESELEKVIYEFAVHFQKEKIQKQIDESLRASQAVDRQLQRLRNQNRDLHTKIENNQRQKTELEQALEKNRVDLETLTQRLAQNEKDQDSVTMAAQQIKKAIEMHQQRQQQVQ